VTLDVFAWWRQIGAPVTGHVEASPDPDALELDAEGFLVGDRVQLVPSVRSSALSTPQGPIAIVWHYTATDHGTAPSLARRIRAYKRGVDRAASWHVCIGYDGVLWQSVSCMRGAWHCAKGTIQGHRVNSCSVGIELEGHGTLFPTAQVRAAERLLRALVAAYPIEREHAGHGHVEFDPSRRSDPGPIFLEEILPPMLDRVYG
jgi:N-acetyl-anhydromuramyl-L-alanine amidase AmpD